MTKLIAYTSIICPLLEYSDAFRDPYTETGINRIEQIQRKAFHIIHNIIGTFP